MGYGLHIGNRDFESLALISTIPTKVLLAFRRTFCEFRELYTLKYRTRPFYSTSRRIVHSN